MAFPEARSSSSVFTVITEEGNIYIISVLSLRNAENLRLRIFVYMLCENSEINNYICDKFETITNFSGSSTSNFH